VNNEETKKKIPNYLIFFMSWQNLVMYLSTNNFGGPLKMASTIVNHCLVVELGFNLDIELEFRSFFLF
jgi:hypothetical protein